MSGGFRRRSFSGSSRRPDLADAPDRADEEIPLQGGRLTPGVVRLGDTVRRPRASGSVVAVGRLLERLEQAGFAGAPRHLGSDEEGRDVLAYLEGETVPRWQRWTDGQVVAAARLLRAFHDATAGHVICNGREVVCHGDPGSNNAVFRDGKPVAWIDFDAARPGRRLEDVAYFTWSWCLSSRPDRAPIEEQARQARLAADAYGLSAADRAGLVEEIVARQGANAGWWIEQQQVSELAAVRRRAAEMARWSRREREFTCAHRQVLRAALA